MIRSAVLFLGCFLIIFGIVDCLSSVEYKSYVRANGAARYVYLTNICAYVSIVCFTFGLVLRIGKVITAKRYFFARLTTLRKQLVLRRCYVSVLPFMLTVNSTVMSGYWYLFFTDQDSIVTREPGTDHKPNTFINLCQHFVPWIVTLIEALFVRARYTVRTFAAVVVFAVLYYTLIRTYHAHSGKWPYKFFNGQSYTKVLVLVCVFALAGLVIAFTILKVHEFVRRNYLDRQKSNKPG